jgi:hypothetical protein
VFKRAGGVWVQEAYLKASNTGEDDVFGRSVSLSGNTLAVGARGEDSAATGVDGDQGDNGASRSGAVYVFKRAGAVWAQEAYLKASNTGGNDEFGHSVSLSGDILAVSAWQEDGASIGFNGDQGDDGATASGAVYVFKRTGSVWAQTAYLKASNTDADDEFGYSVSLSGDILAVGAHQEDSAAISIGGDQTSNTLSDSGAVYIRKIAP